MVIYVLLLILFRRSYENVEKERKQTLQRIGKALMIFEGFYTGRSRIARQGLAQIFPMDIAKYMARCFDYKAVLFEQPAASKL